MTDALLPRNGDEELGGSGGDGVVKVGWRTETAYLLGLSAPAIVQLAAQQGLVVTNQVTALDSIACLRPMLTGQRTIRRHACNALTPCFLSISYVVVGSADMRSICTVHLVSLT